MFASSGALSKEANLCSVATWAAVADWHQCGMFRCTPVVTTIELACNHPCSPELWDASDANEFADLIAVEQASLAATQASNHSCIRDFVDTLMSDKWNPRLEFPPGSVSIFDINTVCVGK